MADESVAFAGDMLLTPGQAEQMLANLASRNSLNSDRPKRSIHADVTRRWGTEGWIGGLECGDVGFAEGTVPYMFDEGMEAEWWVMDTVEEAVSWWEKHACLTFQYTDPADLAPSQDAIVFTRRGG